MTPSPRAALLALLAVATLGARPQPALGQGQTLDSLRLGARVRVTAPPRARTTGTLLGRPGDTLLVVLPVRGAPAPDTLRVALGAVRRLDVSLGRRRRVLGSALTGYAAGAALGGLVGYLALDAGQPAGSNLKGLGFGVGAMLGSGAGLVTGIVVGRRPVERWQAVSLPVSP